MSGNNNIEFFDDCDTIPKVNWASDSTKTLYARWQEKNCKVEYYKGTSEQVTFNLIRRLTPKNGGNWIGYKELESGDGYTLYYCDTSDVIDKWVRFPLNNLRILKKQNNGNWTNYNEIINGDGGKWYYRGTALTKTELTYGDIAIIETAEITNEGDEITDEVYGPENLGIYYYDGQNWIAYPVDLIITKQNDENWESINEINNQTIRYFCGFTKNMLIATELAFDVNGRLYQYKNTIKPYWKEETGNIDTDPWLQITKQDGSNWDSEDELKAKDTSYYVFGKKITPDNRSFAVVKGKWYANGVETTPREGDCAYINSKDENGKNIVQQWEYDGGCWNKIDQYEQNDYEESINDTGDAPAKYKAIIETNGTLTKSGGTLWNNLQELEAGDNGTWYQDGEPILVLKPDEEYIAIVQDPTSQIQTIYIYKNSHWQEYEDDSTTGKDEYIQQVIIGNKAVLDPNKFIKDGYNFLGWCTQRTKDLPPYINTNLKEVQENGNTIYQQFVKRNYQMTSVPDAERTGYRFLGWFTSDGGSFAKGTYVSEDIMVYPRWQRMDGPSPAPAPTPEDDGNPGGSSQSQGLDETKYVEDKTFGTGVGLCGNILYMDFYAAKDANGKTLPNCGLYIQTSGQGNAKCTHYRACCNTKGYTHPDAPGKKFLKVEVLPGMDLDKIALVDDPSKMVDISQYAAQLNNGSWYPKKKTPPKRFQEAVPDYNKYDWANFGQWGAEPLMQWPGHKFLGWYLGYDSCTCKNTTLPIQGPGIYYRPQGTGRQSFYISIEYMQSVARTIGSKPNFYKGFIFYPKFAD